MNKVEFDKFVGTTAENITYLNDVNRCGIGFLISRSDNKDNNIDYFGDNVILRMCDVKLYNIIYCKIMI